MSKTAVSKFAPLVQNYQKRVFQDFLEPLNMPNLKINSRAALYNEKAALQNWRLKKSVDALPIHNYTDNRLILDEVLDLLVELTPADLLREQNLQRQLQPSKRHEVPKYSFHEVPKLSSDMTPEQFEAYIYFLTHCKIYYRNSSSMSGIVNDILLYTHKLDNHQFKSLRSTSTYNCLIKYYGYDKNQSSFARSLLIVMEKDGHSMNIDTINALLKILNINSNIRSNSNNLQLNLKYLKLCQKLGLRANLSTWTTIYDSIHNLYLKENFLNRVLLVNLPIPKSLVYKIVDDYMRFCGSKAELVNFIDRELSFSNWKLDSILSNKVLSFDIVVSSNMSSSVRDIDALVACYGHDEYTLKYIMEGTMRSSMTDENKLAVMMKHYALNKHTLCNIPIVYKYLVDQIARMDSSVETSNFVFRGLISDATHKLMLPRLTIQYDNGHTHENLKIFERIVGNNYNRMKILYKQFGLEISELGDEEASWSRFLSTAQECQSCTDVGLDPTTKFKLTSRFERDLKANRRNLVRVTSQHKLHKLSQAPEDRIKERHLL